jgi:hypothetical protein
MRLTALAQQPLALSERSHTDADGTTIDITLKNNGHVPALLAKLTLLDAAGDRVLPAFYSDNYVSLLPGETRTIRAQCPAAGRSCAAVSLRGWNVASDRIIVGSQGGK